MQGEVTALTFKVKLAWSQTRKCVVSVEYSRGLKRESAWFQSNIRVVSNEQIAITPVKLATSAA